MPQYVDGFVFPVKKTKLKEYKKMAALGARLWMKYGALHYSECVAEDFSGPWGKNFKKTHKLKANEILFFSFIVYKSKAQRNKINKLIHTDPSLKKWENTPMPFNMKTFCSAGFKVAVAGKKKKR